eukprot:1140266-Pelagomonas_calceolata.AAC.5
MQASESYAQSMRVPCLSPFQSTRNSGPVTGREASPSPANSNLRRFRHEGGVAMVLSQLARCESADRTLPSPYTVRASQASSSVVCFISPSALLQHQLLGMCLRILQCFLPTLPAWLGPTAVSTACLDNRGHSDLECVIDAIQACCA